MTDTPATTDPPARPRAADASAKRRRTWDDAPLRHKLSLVVAVGVVWGVAIGQAVEHLGMPSWAGPVAAVVLAVVLVQLVGWWVAEPIESLVERIERAARPNRPAGTASLPRERHDEVGRIARAVHRITVASIRDSHEASRLRRDIDHRIDKATRRATSELSKMAMRDPLTSLGNRRFLDQHLDDLTRTCLAASSDLVCVLIDLDDFKPVNDTLGHAAGDDLIQFAGSLIRGSIREQDVAVRMGGDEFVVLLPGADVPRAEAFVARVRSLFREHVRTTLDDSVKPDISAGIASLLQDGIADGEALIERADQRLYKAKADGKGATATGV